MSWNLKSSKVIWDYTTRIYIPNTIKFEQIHTWIGSQLNYINLIN